MRFVRCEDCGAKALIAASQCPRCTHPLELRDSRGEPVPLAHCRSCDTYYPRSRGGCKWCGTKAPAAVALPLPAIGGVVAVLLLGGIGYWQYQARRGGADSGEAAAVVAAQPPAIAPQDTLPATASATDSAGTAGDTTRPDTAAPAALPSVPVAQPQAAVPAPTLAPSNVTPTATPSVNPAATATRPGAAVSPPPASPTQPAASPLPAPPPAIPTGPSATDRYAGPWSRAVALEWVNVRGTPAREAGVVGVVTPNTRVLLGDVKMGWRRVRAAGFEGWADSRYFAADSVRR